MKIQQGSTDITRQMINKGVQDIVASTPSVDTYYLDPSSAGIVEGVVNDTVALNNTAIINSEIQTAKTGGYDVFEVPTMDAYFDTFGDGSKFTMHEGAIKIPDNFHFKMTAGTVLRRQPNNYNRSHLLSVCYIDGDPNQTAENVEISGGTLIGDINDHIYTQYYTLTSALTTTTVEIEIEREYIKTVYSIPVTVSDVNTNASEIATWLNTNVGDLYATSSGAVITLYGNAGIYVLMDADDTDTSGANFTGWQDISYGYGISLYGAHDAYVHDISILDFHGDAIFAGITGLRNINGTIPSNERTCENVLIQRIYTENCRRQGISIVDCNPGSLGYGVTVDDCTITDTGRDIFTLPAYGIDLEPFRGRDGGGNLLEYARVEGVVIKNSTFTGNRKGDIDLYAPQFVEIFGNTFDYKIGNVACNNISIHNNTFTGLGVASESAISINTFVSPLGNELVFNIEVYNNTINAGYTFPFAFSGDNFEVYSNTIVDPLNIGILVADKLTNSYFHDNNISSTSGGTGIGNQVAGTLTNVLFENETINMGGVGVGGGVGTRLVNITGAGVTDINGIVFRTCNINGDYPIDIKVENSTNITFEDCTYDEPETVSGNTNVLFTSTAVAKNSIFFADVFNDTTLAFTNKEAIAATILSKNPTYLMYGGDIYPDGTPAEVEVTLAPYDTLINAGKFYYTSGDHENEYASTIATLSANLGTEIFAREDNWKYLELPNGNSFPTDWKLDSFNDTSWTTSAGGFGYGTVTGTTRATTLTSGLQNYLFRKVVNSSSIASDGLAIELSVSGGSEIYINGVLRYSYNMFYPITEASTALDDMLNQVTYYADGYQQIIRIPASYFDVVGDNQIAVLVKNLSTSSTKVQFEMQMTNYTFPTVTGFEGVTFQSHGIGDGIWTKAPYLPPNYDQYILQQDNIDYFFIKGPERNNDVNTISAPAGWGINSQSADWLKTELAASTADVKILVTHHGTASWKLGNGARPYHNYILENPLDYPIDLILHGDTHLSEAFEHSPSGIKTYSGSYMGDALRNVYPAAATGATTGYATSTIPNTYECIFFDYEPLRNLFIEITTNPSGVVTLSYVDKDGNATYHNEQLFPKP